MAKEIERKFIVISDSYMTMASSSVRIRQGYIFDTEKGVLRIRIKGDDAFLTIKSSNRGLVRDEWEYPVPVEDATEMLSLAGGKVIEKTRYFVPFEGHIWEVDIFEGKLAGLKIAEVELPSAETPVTLPPFAGTEVSDDPRYFNSSLAASLDS